MPIYEYYCPTCRSRFEARRPMSMATAVATCEHGHESTRTISAFSTPKAGEEIGGEMMGGGGCCGGGGCGCSAGFQN